MCRVNDASLQGRVCEIGDGGGPHLTVYMQVLDQAKYTTDVPESTFALPSYCSPKKSCFP